MAISSRRYAQGGAWWRLAACLLCCQWSAVQGMGAGQGAAASFQLSTNQGYIESVYHQPVVEMADKMAVFRLLFASLPDRVRVYPSENYYYFSFHYQGVPYAGNLRLAADDRDHGRIHFAYYRDYRDWYSEAEGEYAILDSQVGVEVKRLEPLLYAVGFDGRQVLFELNDLSKMQPPTGFVRPRERYIGPVFDESGIRFFLIYNPEVKLFHFILDETPPQVERLFPSAENEAIWIGNRSGFAFYQDRYRQRKILIGVYNGNANINNYFDGPFDQLPDNFIQGDDLKNAIIDADAEMQGKIDRFGNFSDGEHRYMIAPYRHYWDPSELLSFHTCALKRLRQNGEAYYACFVAAEEQGEEGPEQAIEEKHIPRETK